MRRNFLYPLLFAVFFFSCDDGDLTIDNISFDGQTASSCSFQTDVSFLYKVQSNKALILMFDKTILKNEVQSIKGDIPAKFRLIYRTFSSTPSAEYFCNTPPPTTPVVQSQIEAKGGIVKIETKEVVQGTTKRYDHLITIEDLIMVNDKGEKLINSSFIFGTYSTKPQ